MKFDLKEVKPGDKFYYRSTWNGICFITIHHVTPTGILVDTNKNKYRNGHLITSDKWYGCYIQPVTDDIMKEVEHKKLLSWFCSVNWGEFSFNELTKIKNVIDEIKKKVV